MALKRRGEAGSGKNGGGGGSAVELLKAGEYEGRLVYVADLGLQDRTFKDDVKPPAQQVSLGIEILGETVEIDGKVLPRLMWTKPFNVFNIMNGKGNELKMIRVFLPDSQEDDEGDWDAALNVPCSVHVTCDAAKSGSVYNNISMLTPIPAKYRDGVAPATITPAIGDADDDDNVVTAALFGLTKWKHENRIVNTEF